MTIKELADDFRRLGAFWENESFNKGIAAAYRDCALRLEDEYNRSPSDLFCPVPELRGKIPAVIYFSNDSDFEEFQLAFMELKPNCEVRKL